MVRWGKMKRRQLLAGALAGFGALVSAGVPAFAASYTEQIISQLQKQGFAAIQVERTWLGRTRIEAMRGDVSREIVLNPTTGEILRDLWLSSSGEAAATIKIGEDDDTAESDGGGGNSGHGGGDEDNDEDNSGHGGGGDGGGDGDDAD